MIVVLPWPMRALSPNARVCWSVKAKTAAQSRQDAYYRALMAPAIYRDVLRDSAALRLVLTFYPPDRRMRDLDNLVSAEKFAIDGICAACKIDDSLIRETVAKWGDVMPGGSVRVLLEQLP